MRNAEYKFHLDLFRIPNSVFDIPHSAFHILEGRDPQMANMLPMLKSSFDRLRDEIDTTFDRWLTRRPEGGAEGAWPEMISVGMPRIDMEEDEHEYRVTAELPGLEKDDFKVELLGDRLLIKGEKKTTHEEKKRNYYLSECSYGSFSRAIPLPSEVNAEKIEANYKNGILTLRLPKSENAKTKMIDVKVA